MSYIGIYDCANFMEVDLLLAKVQREAAGLELSCLKTQHSFVERDRSSNARDGQDYMV